MSGHTPWADLKAKTEAERPHPHLHANEQGVKMLFGKPYRWDRDTPRSPLRLVPVTPESIAADYDAKAASSVR